MDVAAAIVGRVVIYIALFIFIGFAVYGCNEAQKRAGPGQFAIPAPAFGFNGSGSSGETGSTDQVPGNWARN